MNSPLQVDVIDDYSEFNSLRSQWDAIYELDDEARFFLSWAWISLIFQRYPEGTRVLAVRKADAERGTGYVAFFPIRFRTRLDKKRGCFTTEVRMAGSYFWSDYMGFICHPDFEEVAITKLSQSLLDFSWSCLALKNVYISERRLNHLLAPFKTPEFSIEDRPRRTREENYNLLVCPSVDLPGDYESYLQEKVSSKMRQKLRRYMRKVESSDELHIRVSNEETFSHNIDLLVEMWRRKWAYQKGEDVNRLVSKYRQILNSAYNAGLLYLPVLWRGDEAVGALASFIDNQKKCLLFFVTGRDETVNDPSPGMLLHAYSIRWAIEHGLRTYDFLRGDERYKYSFGTVDRQLKFINVRTASKRNPDDKLDPHCIDKVINTCIKYQRQGKTAKAELGYEQILRSDPGNSVALRQCGKLLYRQKRYNRASQLYKNLVMQQPKRAENWFFLGKALLALNSLVEAESALRKALALRKNPSASNYYYLGRVLEALGRNESALIQYQLAVELPPRSHSAKSNAQRAREKLKQNSAKS